MVQRVSWVNCVSQSCPTLCDPRDYSPPGFSQGQDLTQACPPCSLKGSRKASGDGRYTGNFSRLLTLSGLKKNKTHSLFRLWANQISLKSFPASWVDSWEEERSRLYPRAPWSLCHVPLLILLSLLHGCTAGSVWEREWRNSGNCCHFCMALRGQESSYCHTGPASQALDFCSFMVIRKQNLKSQFWLRTLCPIFSWPWWRMVWSILNLIYNDGPCEAGKCYVNTP